MSRSSSIIDLTADEAEFIPSAAELIDGDFAHHHEHEHISHIEKPSQHSNKRSLTEETSSNVSASKSRKVAASEKWKPFYMLKSAGLTQANHTNLTLNDILDIDSSMATISQIVLINFMFDIDWLISECPGLLSYPVLCVHGSDWVQSSVLPPTIYSAQVHMKLERYGTHHSKMALIFTDIGIRIAIFTANFIQMDFKFMSNAVYVQDFPLRSDTTTVNRNPFYVYLSAYMAQVSLKKHQQLFDNMMKKLAYYDYSAAEVDLVASSPGRYHGEHLCRYGHYRLRALLQSYESRDHRPHAHHTLVMQFSSIGSMGKNDQFFDELVASMSSQQPSSTAKGSASSSSSKSHSQASASQTQHESRSDIQVIWPSVESVRNSVVVRDDFPIIL
jgi:hypothetical protein